MARKFLQSEQFKMFAQYCAAGFAMIPAGIFYAVLLNHGHNEKFAFKLSLAIAVLVGTSTWFLVEYAMKQPDLAIVHATTATNVNWQITYAQPAFVRTNRANLDFYKRDTVSKAQSSPMKQRTGTATTIFPVAA